MDISKIKRRLWQKYLPGLSENSAAQGTPYDYFAVFFKDPSNHRYTLQSVSGDSDRHCVQLTPLVQGNAVTKSIDDIVGMEEEIIHYKKNYSLSYNNIFLYTVDRYLKLITLKTNFSRLKGKLVSGLKADRETISSDRFNLLKLLVAQYVSQRPSRASSGFSLDEIIALLYGALWYQHIKNESFRRRIKLLLESLVITGDLCEKEDVYYVQGQSITTLVEFEKEQRRTTQQQKMHRNIVRFMLVITIATMLIILVLLAMAGIVDLHVIWQKITAIKPIKILMTFI